MERKLKGEFLNMLAQTMIQEEKSAATRGKYFRDVQAFFSFIGEREVSKESVIAYKQELTEQYAVSSVNSKLAAVNYFLKLMGWNDCTVKVIKVQRATFRNQERELTREEYQRLLLTARRQGKAWLYLAMLTICSTGIRVSELKFITVEAITIRRAQVQLKGKNRTVILPPELCLELQGYALEKGIKKGSVFVTRSGRPIDRCNLCRAMKKLCKEAKVEKTKVFPHNLRHLFAVTYYENEKNICHLADILGHANINTTRIYTTISSEEQERHISLLGLLLEQT